MPRSARDDPWGHELLWRWVDVGSRLQDRMIADQPERCARDGAGRRILFVLRTGIGWEYLPQEMGCGSGMTCWRRLRDWQLAGVWEGLHVVLLDELPAASYEYET
jgi:transposase